MAEIDPHLFDDLLVMVELGGRIARENCQHADALVADGFVREVGLDRFGRRSLKLTPIGKAITKSGRWLILREGQALHWAEEHLGGPFVVEVEPRPSHCHPTDPVVVQDRSLNTREVDVWQLAAGYRWEGWDPRTDLEKCECCEGSGIFHDTSEGFVGPCEECDGTGYESEDIRILVLPS